MTSEHYFNELGKAIENVASKGDLLLFDGPIKKKDWDDLFEDVLILHCFHLGYFKAPSKILSRFLEKSNLKEKLSKEERKATGSFFTPVYICDFIISQTLGPIIQKFPENIPKICSLKICDPAMGGGVFLVCVHNFLMNHLVQVNQSEYSIQELSKMASKTIFGVDINPQAVELSKLLLNLNIAKWSVIEKLDEFVNTVENPLF